MKDSAIRKLVQEKKQAYAALAAYAIRLDKAEPLGASREATPGSQPGSQLSRTGSQLYSQAGASSRSAKILNPPVLTDGQDPTFELWELRVRDKLAANSDHFPTARQRLVFVKSYYSGQAPSHLLHRSRPGAVDAYEDAEDVIQHLRLIYDMDDKGQRARSKSRKLVRLKASYRFQSFLSEFTEAGSRDGELRYVSRLI